jgi:uncharacterized membrane protein
MKNNFVRDPERTKRYQKTHRKPQTDNGANTIQQIADYERISGYVWIVLGVIQIVTVIGIIAGIWNVFAGWTRLKIVPNILARNADIPESFEGISGLVIIGILNAVLGGVIGLIFVAFDFFVRDKVLSNRHLFVA